MSANFIHTTEAKKEIRDAFNSAAYYRGTTGDVAYSVSNAFTEKVLAWTT